LVLALAEYRYVFCGNCGHDLNETMASENEFAYKATGPWLCWACQAIGRARERYIEQHPHVVNPDRWQVEKR